MTTIEPDQKYPKIRKKDFSKSLDRFNSILFHSDKTAFDEGIPDWFSMESVVDWHLILLLTNNDDGLYKNFYLYFSNPIPFNMAMYLG